MKIHFIGIGGVGMAALALLLKNEGHEVSGCDLHDGPRIKWLRGNGIRVEIGHAASHVEDADEVVVTPAVRRDNAEFVAATERGILRYRGDVLAALVSRTDSVAVCGSHGKTTTATFVAKLLKALGEDPSWAIGGETGEFPVAGTGTGPLVVEADESDGTLAAYHARMLVVTNCEYDHPDHFKTPEEYFACYDEARKKAGEVIEAGELEFGDWEFPVAGRHNRQNARAAVEVALRRGHAREDIEKALPEVLAELPDRRFQLLAPGVYTDYAHHPTEMECAIAMAREQCGEGGTLRVLFQPHRYSRTKALLGDFARVLATADEVVLCPVYAAFEPPVEGGTSADLYAAMRAARDARAMPTRLILARNLEEAWRHVELEVVEGDVTLLLGAGDIISLAPRASQFRCVKERRDARELSGLSFFRTGGRSVGGGERIVVGAGSNLWISDLDTDVEYVHSPGPAARSGATLEIPWMAGIPGTIGGWLRMNAGAFGHSISEVVRRVKMDGRWLERDECGFAYRTSSLAGTIEDAEFDMPSSWDSKPMDYLMRRRKFPMRCCGSVFKNPAGDFAGRLLEAVGAKGMKVGGAQVWSEHANVIFASDGATSSDILALAEILRSRVFHRFSIRLEYEIAGMGVNIVANHSPQCAGI